MTWNYRIVKRLNKKSGEVWYGLHEVFYNEDKQPHSMTEEAIFFVGESPEDVIKSLEMALKDAKARPVFEEPEKWSEEK